MTKTKKETALEELHLEWEPITVRIFENREHGFPYLTVISQQRGTGYLKEGPAIYCCGCGGAGPTLDMLQMPPEIFNAMASLQSRALNVASRFLAQRRKGRKP